MKFSLLPGLALVALAACDVGGTETSIPEALQGRWGLVAADCDPARDDAKGLMTVTKTSLAFYESRAVLGAVHGRSASRITADFAFAGEGQTWSRRISLRISEGGQDLVREDLGDDAALLELTYGRCP